jgi:hypothetical protein
MFIVASFCENLLRSVGAKHLSPKSTSRSSGARQIFRQRIYKHLALLGEDTNNVLLRFQLEFVNRK